VAEDYRAAYGQMTMVGGRIVHETPNWSVYFLSPF